MRQAAQRPRQQGDCAAQPQDIATKQPVDEPRFFLTFHHGEGYLRQWIGQPLAFHPLAPQDHRDGDHARVESEQEDGPPEQRLHPRLIDDVAAIDPNPFEEDPARAFVIDDQTSLGVWQQVEPVVFGSGVVQQPRHGRQQLLAHAHRTDGGDDEEHDVHEHQLGTIQCQALSSDCERKINQCAEQKKRGELHTRFMCVEAGAGPVPYEVAAEGAGSEDDGGEKTSGGELEQHIQPADENKEQEDRSGRAEVEGHERGLHDHVDVGGAGSQKEAEKRPRPHGPRGQTAPLEPGYPPVPQMCVVLCRQIPVQRLSVPFESAPPRPVALADTLLYRHGTAVLEVDQQHLQTDEHRQHGKHHRARAGVAPRLLAESNPCPKETKLSSTEVTACVLLRPRRAGFLDESSLLLTREHLLLDSLWISPDL